MLERIEGPLVGPRRDDLRTAQILAMLYNRSRGQRDKALEPEDLVLKFHIPKEFAELDPDERRSFERAMFGPRKS